MPLRLRHAYNDMKYLRTFIFRTPLRLSFQCQDEGDCELRTSNHLPPVPAVDLVSTPKMIENIGLPLAELLDSAKI